jgi:hypothetical protein
MPAPDNRFLGHKLPWPNGVGVVCFLGCVICLLAAVGGVEPAAMGVSSAVLFVGGSIIMCAERVLEQLAWIEVRIIESGGIEIQKTKPLVEEDDKIG